MAEDRLVWKDPVVDRVYRCVETCDYEDLAKAFVEDDGEFLEEFTTIVYAHLDGAMDLGMKIYDENGCKVGFESDPPDLWSAADSVQFLAKAKSCISCAGDAVPEAATFAVNYCLRMAAEELATRVKEGLSDDGPSFLRGTRGLDRTADLPPA